MVGAMQVCILVQSKIHSRSCLFAIVVVQRRGRAPHATAGRARTRCSRPLEDALKITCRRRSVRCRARMLPWCQVAKNVPYRRRLSVSSRCRQRRRPLGAKGSRGKPSPRHQRGSTGTLARCQARPRSGHKRRCRRYQVCVLLRSRLPCCCFVGRSRGLLMAREDVDGRHVDLAVTSVDAARWWSRQEQPLPFRRPIIQQKGIL